MRVRRRARSPCAEVSLAHDFRSPPPGAPERKKRCWKRGGKRVSKEGAGGKGGSEGKVAQRERWLRGKGGSGPCRRRTSDRHRGRRPPTSTRPRPPTYPPPPWRGRPRRRLARWRPARGKLCRIP